MPVKAAAGSQILGGVPEGAVVRRVDAHAAVVAPAVETSGLGPGTLNNAVFAFERPQRIAGHAAGITDGGVNAAARGAVSHGDVARLVHAD